MIKKLAYAVAVSAVISSPLALAQKADPVWANCNPHGGSCLLKGKNDVRYGYEGNWATLNGHNGAIGCMPSAFSAGEITGDPFGDGLEAVKKTCQVLE